MISDQKRVEAFLTQYQLKTKPLFRLLDLQSEVGELAKEILKGSNYGKETITLGPDWENELGDIYFSLLCLAVESGTDLRKALERALHKYERRLKEKSHPGSQKN